MHLGRLQIKTGALYLKQLEQLNWKVKPKHWSISGPVGGEQACLRSDQAGLWQRRRHLHVLLKLCRLLAHRPRSMVSWDPTSGQSCKHFVLVNYDSGVIITGKLLIFTTLELQFALVTRGFIRLTTDVGDYLSSLFIVDNYTFLLAGQWTGLSVDNIFSSERCLILEWVECSRQKCKDGFYSWT